MKGLESNTKLQNGKYRILSMLGHGGFGITYLASQTMLDRRVCIKEFFMKELCDRNIVDNSITCSESSKDTVALYTNKFLKEARSIASLKNDNIVKIIDIFEENNTAYYVMDYIEAGSLADKVNSFGYLPESLATKYILDIAKALMSIHNHKMTHLDIKPANIMIDENNKAILIDFGLAKQYNQNGEQISRTPVGISEGYAPLEQYNASGMCEFSPETDIYALGATYFKALTGITPPNASIINERGVNLEELRHRGINEIIISLISNMMEPKRGDRIKDIHDVINVLEKNLNLHTTMFTEGSDDTIIDGSNNEGKKTSSMKLYLYGLLIVVLMSSLVSIVFFLTRNNNNTETNSIEVVDNKEVILYDGTVVLWSGPVKDNIPEGKGTIVYREDDKDGRDRYVGHYVEGKRQDQNAALYYKNGDSFIGSFENDHFAKGRLTHVTDGTYYEGTFKDDVEYNGKRYFSSDNSIYSIIENGKEIEQ